MQAPISNSEGVRKALNFPKKSAYPFKNLEVQEPKPPYAVNYGPPTHKIPYYNPGKYYWILRTLFNLKNVLMAMEKNISSWKIA